MNRGLRVFAALSMTAFLWPRPKTVHAEASPPLAHVRNAFDLIVPAPYSIAAPLFGPNGERAWAGQHWDPQFLYPQPGKDVQGAVFTVKHGEHTSVWINTIFDLTGRHFQYVYFVPDVMVTTIDVNFRLLGEDRTAVHVVYTRTALRFEANKAVESLGAKDRTSGNEWQEAISAYLKRR